MNNKFIDEMEDLLLEEQTQLIQNMNGLAGFKRLTTLKRKSD